MSPSLVEHLEQLKHQIADCRDTEELIAIWKDCREAEERLQQVTNMAADMANTLSRRNVPPSWRPFIVPLPRRQA